ncbi:LysR family transcriptional regulator [Nocardioidaceae bacterium]|nr:LysR family transcriptional regulator [Nocardioidaceae bacterium]
MIDTRLRVLQVVAHRGTLAAAAHDLGYTPSALSAQLRTLSRDVGTPLLQPEGRRLRLTPAGRVLLERADALFAEWAEVHAAVLAAGGTGLGRLRLAGFSTAASALLAEVATSARDEAVETTVTVIEAEPLACFEMLLADRADIAVVVAGGPLPPSDDPRFEQQPLLVDTLDLLVPAGHRLAERESISLVEAEHEPWITDRPGSTYSDLTLAACSAAGFVPRQAHQALEWDTAASLVAAGLGVALIPRLARLPLVGSLVRVPLRGEGAPVRHVRTAVRRGTSSQPEIAWGLQCLRRTADRLTAETTA